LSARVISPSLAGLFGGWWFIKNSSRLTALLFLRKEHKNDRNIDTAPDSMIGIKYSTFAHSCVDIIEADATINELVLAELDSNKF
jgi:hypothetical protein